MLRASPPPAASCWKGQVPSMGGYVLAVDQSTQGTKAVLFSAEGRLIAKCARPHRQIIHDNGFVEHDGEEIIANVLAVIREVVEMAGVDSGEVACLGISNQRETCIAWDRSTGTPLYNAIVWQCSRAKDICAQMETADPTIAERVRELSGMNLSPYFSAGKMAWLVRNVPAVNDAAKAGTLALGTMDSWVLFALSEERAFATEPSNASRTQLMDIDACAWSEELCAAFGVPMDALAELRASDSVFGHTTAGGFFEKPIPICGMLGDSQAALMGQGCLRAGQVKATYGTGSSIMMQTGGERVRSGAGLVTSLGWEMDRARSYVLEGNINYTGAVVSWMVDDARLIGDPGDAEVCARRANPADGAYFVPAFTGLGAPHWDNEATAILTGVTRTTGHDEIVKAGLESIAYQINDVVDAMRADTGLDVAELCVDGGPTANGYLMQFQADVSKAKVSVSSVAELSAAGVAYVAGHAAGIYDANAIFERIERTIYEPAMEQSRRSALLAGWKAAVRQAMHR